MQEVFFAHSIEGWDSQKWQPLSRHLHNVAELARDRGSKFGAGQAAALAGLLHDLGKYSAEFQAYLRSEGGSVDHSTAGAQAVLNLSSPADTPLPELIAYAIAGHHAGMPDKFGEGEATLHARLGKSVPALDAGWAEEIGTPPSQISPERFGWHPNKKRRPFQIAMLARMLFSCLVDADFRDTESFYAAAEGWAVQRDGWAAVAELGVRLERHLSSLRERASDTPVNRLRSRVLDHVRGQSDQPTGLFSLTVPTGGGKTLTSLAFALDHAVRHGLDRVVYAIPFTSVIDQTAAIFRDVLGAEAVLEHHSAIDEEKVSGRQGRSKLRLAMEDWSAPVVVTTNVQLFESLFSNRPSRCRKLHNLARSVIVLDEAQTIPLHVLNPCVAAIDELARNYGSSVVLCTATQPALEEPSFKGGFTHVRELAPDPPELQRALQRVQLARAGVMSDDELVAALRAHEQALVVVNSRSHALTLYRTAKAEELDGLVHLTTRMVAAHRREVIKLVRRRLDPERPEACRVIATSLVEAGIDLDFPRVWRAKAGLDSILQAAGRCNREGRRRREDSIVTIFIPLEHEPPREIKAFAEAMERVATRHAELAALEAITDYFREVYWQKGPEALDRDKVMEQFQASATETNFAFRSVAETFRLIEDGMAPVIVPRDAMSRRAVAELVNAEKTGGIARRLQSYLVQVPPKDRETLIRFGQVRFADPAQQFAVLEEEALYDPELGLLWEEARRLRTEIV